MADLLWCPVAVAFLFYKNDGTGEVQMLATTTAARTYQIAVSRDGHTLDGSLNMQTVVLLSSSINQTVSPSPQFCQELLAPSKKIGISLIYSKKRDVQFFSVSTNPNVRRFDWHVGQSFQCHRHHHYHHQSHWSFQKKWPVLGNDAVCGNSVNVVANIEVRGKWFGVWKREKLTYQWCTIWPWQLEPFLGSILHHAGTGYINTYSSSLSTCCVTVAAFTYVHTTRLPLLNMDLVRLIQQTLTHISRIVYVCWKLKRKALLSKWQTGTGGAWTCAART